MTTYTFVPTVDGLIDVLQAVPALAGATVHRYLPWETLTADDLQLHVAVFPTGDTYSMDRGSFANVPIESLGLIQGYSLVIWQATPEGERADGDEDAGRELLDLIDDIRDLFVGGAQNTLAGNMEVKYVQARIGMSGRVRWAKVELMATRVLS